MGVSSTSLHFPIVPKVVIKLFQLKGWPPKPLPGSGCFFPRPVTKEASGLGVGLQPGFNSQRATVKGV